MNSKWIKDLNLRPKPMKRLEENLIVNRNIYTKRHPTLFKSIIHNAVLGWEVCLEHIEAVYIKLMVLYWVVHIWSYYLNLQNVWLELGDSSVVMETSFTFYFSNVCAKIEIKSTIRISKSWHNWLFHFIFFRLPLECTKLKIIL